MAETSILIGCDQCLKSTLSLLLLRPSPVPLGPPLALPGADAVRADERVLSGVVPSRKPTESRWVLRLLRAGFVHVYLPSPPPGVEPWLSYRVTDNADLIPQNSPVFNQQPYAPCVKREHNPAGMKLLALPKPHLMLGPIWIAYSANLWNDKLKARNAANPQEAMVQVNLAGGSVNTFRPTAQSLRSQVLECSSTYPKFAVDLPLAFAFTSMAGASTESLVTHLERAAARHPQTVGKELAVVLRDPVGVTAELNALRVYRHEITKRLLPQSPDAHPAASLLALQGLRERVIESLELEKKAEEVAPVMSQGAFADIMRTQPNARGWPPETQWTPLVSRDDIVRHGYGKGRVITPDQDERVAQWMLRQGDATWHKYAQCIDRGRIDAWREAFRQRVKSEHGIPQARMEADWWGSRQDDAQYNAYFKLHFDEDDANEFFSAWCAGEIYTQECMQSLTPQPLCDDEALTTAYIAEFNRDINQPSSVLLRAVVANQKTLFDKVAAHFDKKDDDGLAKSREDKLADLAGAVMKAGADKLEALHPTSIQYRWVGTVAYASAALAIAQSAVAAAAAKQLMGGAALGGVGGASSAASKAFDRAKKLLGVTWAIQLARDSASSGTGLRVAMRVTVEFDLKEAALIKARLAGDISPAGVAAQEQALRGAKSEKHRSKIRLTMFTDSHELARFDADVKRAFAQGRGAVVVGVPATPGMPADAVEIAGSKRLVEAMLKAQPAKIALAAQTLRDAVQGGRGLYSLDGAIGVMGLLINGVQFLSNVGVLSEKGYDNLVMANTVDSFFGSLAGAAQLTEAVVSSSITSRLGKPVAEKSLSLAGMRVVASGAGAAGGLALTVGEFIKSHRASEAGDAGAARAYFAAGSMFFGFTTASGLIFAGAVADFMILRGTQAGLWHAIAARVGARALAGGAIRVASIGIPGWGWIFLGAGLAFEGLAIALSPDELQKHLRKSYFGTGDDRFKTLEEETKSLESLQGLPRELPPAPTNVRLSGMSEVNAP